MYFILFDVSFKFRIILNLLWINEKTVIKTSQYMKENDIYETFSLRHLRKL